MKNHTSIIASLLGGMVLGSAITCILRKECHLNKGDIHTKIMGQLDELRKFVAEHHPEQVCNCDNAPTNNENQ